MSTPIRVETPDEQTACTLVRDLIGRFRPELVQDGDRWEVSVHPDRQFDRLVGDVLSAVEEWLDESEIPWTTVHVDGRAYKLQRGASVRSS